MGNVFIRTIIIYLTVVLSLRIMGKRQIGELQPSELVVAIMISEVASVSLQSTDIPLIFGIIPVLTLVSLEMIISFISLKNRRFRKIMSGSPCIIIEDGKILQPVMKKLRISIDDLMEELRLKNITSIDDVAYAFIETNGQMSIIQTSKSTPPTATDLNVKVDKAMIPKLIVADGEVIKSELTAAGLNEAWLAKALKSEQIKSIKEVFILWHFEDGKINLIKKEHSV